MSEQKTAIIATLILAFLMASSPFLVFSNSASGSVNTSIMSSSVNQATDYGDITQYDFSQWMGNSSGTRYSPGPAPNSADILWRAKIPGILKPDESRIAIDGKVIVRTIGSVIALDPFTGSELWKAPIPGWGALTGIDDDHVLVGVSITGPGPGAIDLAPGAACLDPTNGKIVWTNPIMEIGELAEGGNCYSPEEKMLYEPKYGMKISNWTRDISDWAIRAWNFSDPDNPTIAWTTPIESITADTGLWYGGGKVFTGLPDGFIVALDAKTGAIVWQTSVTGASMYAGCYYMGRVLKGGLDNSFYCLDGDTGKVLWRFDPGTFWGFWSCGPSAAYGMVYQVSTDGHLYALDVETGKCVWKYGGAYEGNPYGVLDFYPGFPLTADGKVFSRIGTGNARNQDTGEYSRNEFVCLDAYTGKLIWTLPVSTWLAHDGAICSYGNIYLCPALASPENAGAPGMVIDLHIPLGEVWCIGYSTPSSNTPTGWSMYRGNAAHTVGGGSLPVGPGGPQNLALKWKFETGGAVISSPTIVDGVVYVGSNDKNIYALDAETGSKIWNFTTGYEVKSSPAVVDGKVYTGADDGNIYCLNAETGKQIWKISAGGITSYKMGWGMTSIRSSPIVVGSRVYVGSLDKNLYCLDANAGTVIWKFPSGGPIFSSVTAIANDGLYFTSSTPPTADNPNGTLYKLNANTGSVIWKVGITRTSLVTGNALIFEMQATPTVADSMVFVPDDNWYLYCMNSTTGSVLWKYKFTAAGSAPPMLGGVLYVEGLVYMPDQFSIACLNAKNGTKIWSSWLGREVYSAPSYAYGKIYAACDEGTFRVLDAKTGARLSYYHPGVNIWSLPSLYNGRMYIGAHDFCVYCFEQADLGLTTFYGFSLTISATVSKSQITQGESVTVTGALNPALANTPIKVSFIRPDQTTVDINVTTDANGAFTASCQPDSTGSWCTIAWFEGGQGYAKAETDVLSINVLASTTPPTTPPPEGIPVEYIYAAVAVVVIVIIAIGAYAYKKRPKKSAV